MWFYLNIKSWDKFGKILILSRFSYYSQAILLLVFGICLAFLIFNVGWVIIGIVYFGDDFCFKYLDLIVFQFLGLLCMWVYQLFIYWLEFFIFTLINSVPVIMFVTHGVLFAGSLVSFSVTVFSHICFSMFGYFIEFLRAIVIISIYPGSYYEVRRRGVRLNTIFGFRPLAPRSLSSAGVAYRALLIMEVVLFQLLYTIFQFVWTGFSIPWYFGISVLNSMFIGPYLGSFLVMNIQRFNEMLSFWEFCIWAGVGFIFFVIFFIIYRRADRVQNFFNCQTLFAFVVPNKWFGSNFFPDSSFFSVFASVIRVRGRVIESGIRRLESLIIFTSQLRLDPKQVDLSYW